MNFDEAIQAHAAWKLKLSRYLGRPDGSLKAADIECDDKCPLGQWIHGEGTRYSSLPEYATLKTEHARFHRAAAGVVRRADSGSDKSEETALGSSSEFSTASGGIVTAILAIRRKV